MSQARATSPPSAELIEIRERPLRCFVWGLIALLPGLGLIPGGNVFWAADHVRLR